MKLFATGDCHGDLVTGGFERHGEAMGAVRHVALEAIRAGADLFVFLGDLSDPDMEEALAHRAIAELVSIDRMLAQAGIPRRYVVGNHDVIEDGRGSHTLMAIQQAGGHVSARPETFEIAGLHVAVLPYPSLTDKYDPDAFIRSLPGEPDLVLGHMTKIPGFEDGSEGGDMQRGRDMAFPVKACGQALMLNGHYHAHHLNGPVYTPGAPLICTHGEEQNQPGYLEIEMRKTRHGHSHSAKHCKFKDHVRLFTYRQGDSLTSDFVSDSIVRVIPLPDSTAEQRAQLRLQLLDSFGAKHVWFSTPSARGQSVTRAAERAAQREAAGGLGPRQVAMSMVEEAATKDRALLRGVVEGALDEAGA